MTQTTKSVKKMTSKELTQEMACLNHQLIALARRGQRIIEELTVRKNEGRV